MCRTVVDDDDVLTVVDDDVTVEVGEEETTTRGWGARKACAPVDQPRANTTISAQRFILLFVPMVVFEQSSGACM